MWAKMWAKIYYLCNMATINFILQGNNNPTKIYVRFREGRDIDVKAKTRFSINPENWSTTKGQPKNLKDAVFKKLNHDLENLRNEILNHFHNTSSTQPINSKWLKDFFNPPPPEENEDFIPDGLIDHIDYYLKHKKSSIQHASYKKINVFKHLFERFQKTENRQFLVKDVNADFKLRFENYCRKQKYSINTIARAIKFIKTICYSARNNGIETHFQLNSIKIKIEKVEKIFLTKEEIELLINIPFEQDYLDNTRDWLVISCETGQRISDFMRFNKEQIRFQDEVPLIEFTQIKTGKIMAIPLSKRVRLILQKRNGDFPRPLSDQKYNEYIKEVCKIAGINKMTKGSKMNKEENRKESGVFPKYELVTSHIGRRSFATNNYGFIPTSLLINVTGHATEAMFLEYIGKTVTEKAIQLAEYFK